MIVIYTQDATYIKENADAAKDILCSVYGEKLGKEAYKRSQPGAGRSIVPEKRRPVGSGRG